MQIRMTQYTPESPIDMVVRQNDTDGCGKAEYVVASVYHGQLFVRHIGQAVAEQLGLLVDGDGYLKVSRQKI